MSVSGAGQHAAMRAVIAKRLAEEDVLIGQLSTYGMRLFYSPLPRPVRGATAVLSVLGVVGYGATVAEAGAAALALILIPDVEA